MAREIPTTRCCPRPAPGRPLPPARRDRLVALLRALGEGTRLEIFRLLAASPEPVCVCDVVPRFPVGQPTVSHHLRVLREAGLVTVSRRGVWAHYQVRPEALRHLEEAMGDLLPAADRART